MPSTDDHEEERAAAVGPLALVIGGTGLQGSGCLRDLHASGRFRLRTVTRNARAPAAQAWAAKGVEVLQGNLLDRPFLDRAMAGVDMLFLVTFSDHDGTELIQGQNLGDAALAAHVPLVVVSGGERIGVDAMDNKANIEEYLRSLPLPKVVYLHTAFFFENVATKRGTRRVKVEVDPVTGERVAYHFSIPLLRDMQIPFIAPHDIGRFAACVMLHPERFEHGQEVLPLAGDVVSPQQYVDAFARIKNVQATYTQLSLDFFRQLPIPGAHLIVQMYQWYHAGCPGEGHERDPQATRALCPHVRTLEEWLASDGISLIDQAAYQEGWRSRLHDWSIWAAMHVHGAYSRWFKK